MPEAEVRSALRREQRDDNSNLFSAIEFVSVNRPLSVELGRVLDAGYLCGADCWHLATALFVAKNPELLWFITLDAPQRVVAGKLGFRI